MENVRPLTYYEIIKRDWRKVLIVILVVLLISLILSIVQPFLYRATVSILVLQKSSFSIDAYSASKSEERTARKLSQVIYSSSFMDKVLASDFNVDKNYFPADESEKRKAWGKAIEASVPTGLGELDVSVYHSDPNQALAIAQAISYIITANKSDFIEISDIDLKVLDAPLVSKYPVRPRIVLNIFLGMIVGFFLGIAYVVIFYDPDRDKLFAIPRMKHPPVELVEYKDIPKDESVEADIAEAKVTSEIKDVDVIEEIEEEKKPVAEKPQEKQVRFPKKESNASIALPDVKSIIDNDSSVDNEQDFEEQKELEEEEKWEERKPDSTPKKDYRELPKFEDEDKFIGMPEK